MSEGTGTGQVQQVDVDGVALQVRTWGDPAGRPLLFWHPLGDVTSGAYLAELAPTLTTAGLRLVSPDGPGFGGSPALAPEEYAVPRLARLVWGLAAALGLDRPVLMGHSWGGVVTLAAAAERPSDVAALVLLDSGQFDYVGRAGTHPEWSLAERADAIAATQPTYADRADLLRQVQDDLRRPMTEAYAASLDPAMRKAPDGAVTPVATAQTRAAAQHGMLGERSLSRWEALAAADVPALLLLATEPVQAREANDEGARHVAERHPGADIRSLPGWGHDLIGDGGPELAAVIVDWLQTSAVSPPHP